MLRLLLLCLALAGTALAAPREFPEAKLTLDLPEAEWTQTAANRKTSPYNVVLAAFSSKEGGVVSVVSARPKSGQKLVFAGFVQGVKDGFTPPGGKLIREERVTFAGVPAVRLHGTMQVSGHDVTLHILLYQLGDTAWTVTCSAPSGKAEVATRANAAIGELAAGK